MRGKFILIASILLVAPFTQASNDLRVGRAGHAFDHLGDLGEQAEASAASGANIIYATGLGACGYEGLPVEEKIAEKRTAATEYNRQARAKGIKRIIGYVCATSIVKLDAFDKNWPEKFRAQFKTPPSDWRQIGPDGQPLPSWYGGDYQPACMNNPDWRAYEKFMVRQQLESGHDGIFFDNPTVHPQGCYCRHCLGKFTGFLQDQGIGQADFSADKLRELPGKYPNQFLLFRGTIARDFLSEMSTYARTVRRDTLVTCNNSLNTPTALFSQARTYGYNIYEMSKVEDFVLVEDMTSQPRILADGTTVEYGSTYDQLRAISHGKPIVAVTIADGNYHTPPNQVRLAMAEAAAHGGSHLWWPTWPETIRQKMGTAIRPQANFLRKNERFLNETKRRYDALLFLPFRRWAETDKCVVSDLAATLTRSNIQYQVICEDDFTFWLDREISGAQVLVKRGQGKSQARAEASAFLPVFLTESLSVFTDKEKARIKTFEELGGRVIAADQPDWQKKTEPAIGKSVVLKAPSSVRVVLHDQPKRVIAHVYNLAVERVSDSEDKVHPVSNLKIKIRVPFARVQTVEALTADEKLPLDPLKFTVHPNHRSTWVETTIPKLEIATILVIEP